MQKNADIAHLEQRIKELQSKLTKYRAAESRREDSEEKYRQILESITDTVIITDDQGKFTYVCPNTFHIFGMSQSEVFGLESIQRLLDGMVCDASVLRTRGELRNIDCAVTNASGERRSLLVDVKPVEIGGGTVLYVMHDITDRRKSMADLQRYEDIVSATKDGIAFISPDYRYIVVNAAFARLTATDPDRLAGDTMADHLGDSVFERVFRPPIDESLRGESVQRRQWFDVPSKGRRYLAFTYTPYPNGEQGAEGVIANIRDITDSHLLQEQLKQSEAKYRHLVELAQEGIWVIDADNKTSYANPSMARMLGYSPEEMMGKALFDFMDEAGRTMANRNIERRRQGIREQHDFEFIAKGGRRVITTIETAPITDEAGNYQGAIAGVMDVTERRQATRALVKARDKFRALFENSPDIVALTDMDGTILEINRTSPGYRKADVIGTNMADYLSERDRDAFHKAVEIALETGAPQSYRPVIKTPDGKETHWHNRVSVFKTRDAVVQLIINCTDITDNKEMEEALLKSQAHLKSLVNNIPDLIWLKDAEGVYLGCNPTFERFFGAKEIQIIGKTDYDFVDQALADFFRDHDRKAMAAGGPSVNEEALTFAADGYHGLFETIKTPIHEASGALIGVLGIARDITERERAKNEIKKRQSELHHLLQMIQCGIVVHAADTTIVEINPAAQKMLGMPRDLLIGKTADYPDWHYIDENGRPLNPDMYPVNIVKRTKEGLYDYVLGQRHPGKEDPVWFLVNATPEFDDDGELIQIIISAMDISELKKAQSQLALKQQELNQAHKMESIGSLAGGIAHDFNNILSSIIGFSELALEEAPGGSSLEDNLQEIFAAGKRAQDLVKQILTFARQSDDALQPLQVNAIVDEVLKFMRSSIPTTIHIKKQIESSAPIMGNPTQVHQMLMNLCTNAAQAMEQKGGTLFVGLQETTLADEYGLTPGPYVEMIVSDTGVGIDADHLGSIFDPYFTTKPVGSGTGMGLAVVHGLVESYGGRILVDSTIGVGTTVTILLPITQTGKYKPQGDLDELPAGSERILFVDDEAPIAKMGSRTLERMGYTVTTRMSSLEALALFRSKPDAFDLVITDMTMPNMTGEALAVEMMQIRSDIPVILCTGYSNKISDESAAQIGIRAVVYKPVVKSILAKTVRAALDGAKGGALP